MPDGRCPDQKNDSSVKVGEGDLLLCHRCDYERHRMWLETQATTHSAQATASSSSSSATRSTSSTTQATAASSSTTQSGSSTMLADDDDNGECGAVIDNKKYECIIVNELLCYVFNRIDTLPNEELVNIVSRFYDDAEINSALIILKDSVNQYLSSGSRRRLPKRIGKDKKVKSVEDICTLMHDFSAALVDAPATSLPSFVAYKLSRLPTVDSSHLDVSTLSSST